MKSLIALIILLIFLPMPGYTCACAGDDDAPLLAAIFINMAYYLIFPVVIIAVAKDKPQRIKSIVGYFVILGLSIVLHIKHAYFIYATPIIPFVLMLIWISKSKKTPDGVHNF